MGQGLPPRHGYPVDSAPFIENSFLFPPEQQCRFVINLGAQYVCLYAQVLLIDASFTMF